MTVDVSAAALPLPDEIAVSRSASWLARLDAVLTRWGERLNPILVKEARQAMKSRQFVITFALLLICGWLWSLFGVALAGPEVAFRGAGRDIFYGYYVVLAFPLLIIVPFGTFRSLASEYEDRTFELLSITTLSPRQIVGGKLASAVLQMIVYFSALAPCLVFTYLLRGIDMPTILFILFYTFAYSLGLSVVALFLATVTQERHWQMVLSVGLILILAGVFYLALQMADGMLQNFQYAIYGDSFWAVNGFLATMYASYLVLFFVAATVQLTFLSDNRSTPLRITMLAQQVLWTGWMSWVWMSTERVVEPLFIYLTLLAIHWFIMGALMNGESPHLSPRVKRRLPQSFIGRIFLTWFNPGPGTGYVFALSNLLAAMLLAVVALAINSRWFPFSRFGVLRVASDHLLSFGFLLFCYIAIYLGIGRLVVRALRRATHVGMFLALLLHVFFVLAGSLVPLFIYYVSPSFRGRGYSLMHVTDLFWTLGEIGRSGLTGAAAEAAILVPLAAVVVILINLPSIGAELRHVRIAPPRRVREEDAERATNATAAEPGHTNPWN